MEASELELITRLSATHDELRHLVSKHRDFEEKLAQLESIRHPSDLERREIGRIKRLKLRGKERISHILTQSR